jgi:hypothetical protein
MRRRTLFDEGLFIVSFSVAVALAALVLPAKAATSDSETLNRIVNTCAVQDFYASLGIRQPQAPNVRCA